MLKTKGEFPSLISSRTFYFRHDTDYRKWTKVDESYLKTDESMKPGDVTGGGGGDDGTNEWSKSTHARSDSTPKVEQIYHHREDTSNNHSDQFKYRKRERQNYPNRKSPKEQWKGIQSRKMKNHNSPRKNVHWLVDKFSRTCYIKFWNKLEDFGVSFLITLSLSEGFHHRRWSIVSMQTSRDDYFGTPGPGVPDP